MNSVSVTWPVAICSTAWAGGDWGGCNTLQVEQKQMEFSPFVDLELRTEVFCVDVEIPAVSKASYGHLLLLLPLLFTKQIAQKNIFPIFLVNFLQAMSIHLYGLFHDGFRLWNFWAVNCLLYR